MQTVHIERARLSELLQNLQQLTDDERDELARLRDRENRRAANRRWRARNPEHNAQYIKRWRLLRSVQGSMAL